MLRATRLCRALGAALVCISVASLAPAAVIETVPVSNRGNPGELSGVGAGGYGVDRVCGAVGYEYRIGKYEVTAGQYTDFLNAVAEQDTYGLYNPNMDVTVNGQGCNIVRHATPSGYSYSVAPEYADRPVNFVSWGDAARFANWLHNEMREGPQGPNTTEDGAYALNGAMTDVELLAVARKPGATWAVATEDEWYKAAYHRNNGPTGDYYKYPTSSDAVPSNDLVEPDPGNSATFYAGTDDYTIGAPYWRTEFGEHEASGSPYGTFDQGGNVFEWTEQVLEGEYYVIRGGAYQSNFMHAAQRSGQTPTTEKPWIGFRVAEVPEPGSAVLLLTGGLAALRRRRRAYR